MFNLVPGIVALDILLIFYLIQFIFTVSKNSEKAPVAIHFIIPTFCVILLFLIQWRNVFGLELLLILVLVPGIVMQPLWQYDNPDTHSAISVILAILSIFMLLLRLLSVFNISNFNSSNQAITEILQGKRINVSAAKIVKSYNKELNKQYTKINSVVDKTKNKEKNSYLTISEIKSNYNQYNKLQLKYMKDCMQKVSSDSYIGYLQSQNWIGQRIFGYKKYKTRLHYKKTKNFPTTLTATDAKSGVEYQYNVYNGIKVPQTKKKYLNGKYYKQNDNWLKSKSKTNKNK